VDVNLVVYGIFLILASFLYDFLSQTIDILRSHLQRSLKHRENGMEGSRMEKMFVNVFAHSRILKSLTILILAFVIVVDMLIIILVINVMDDASLEERARIIRLMVLLLLSSVAGFPLFYFMHRYLRDQWIKIDDQGIAYNSWAKKISASWDEVTGVSVASRGRYGQALRDKALRIDTRKGQIYALPTFVDKSMPIPQMKLSISNRKLSYPGGKIREINIQDCDICAELRNHIPDRLNASLGRQA